jgi:cyclopropane fatty-acyl-phospholipid synthase-like methyltransferase
MTEPTDHDLLLYGDLTAHIRRMLEPVAHDSFLYYEDTIRLLEHEVQAGAHVFDAGCGRGTITAWLAGRGCQVTAVDASEERVEQTRALLMERNLIENVRLRASFLPDRFPDEQFDVILDCFSWWHISDWGKLYNLSRKSLHQQGKLIVLDTFFGWNTSLDFRQQMRKLWQSALPTYNESRNMLTKRDFRLVRCDSIQDQYRRYLDGMVEKIHELEREDLGEADPLELSRVKLMWEWFHKAAHKDELVATLIVAELTQG